MRRFVGALVALLPIGCAVDAYAATAPVAPSTVRATLSTGASTTVNPTVQAPTSPANPDLVFLADTTGSMGGAIDSVRSNASSIMASIAAGNPSARFAAVQYRDEGDGVAYEVTQNLTTDAAQVTSAMDAWEATGGGDYAEGQIHALYHLATDVAWRTDSNHVVAWFGDAPGHDPSQGVTLDQAIAALVAAHIRVVAVSIGEMDSPVSGSIAAPAMSSAAVQPPGDGLDDVGQATAIVEATGGVLMTTSDPSEVASTIEEGLKALPVTIEPVYSGDTHLAVTFDPATLTVASGTTATFKETITLAAGSPAGTSFTGTVTFKLNGATAADYVQTVAVNSPALPFTSGPQAPLPWIPLGLAVLGLLMVSGAGIAWRVMSPRR